MAAAWLAGGLGLTLSGGLGLLPTGVAGYVIFAFWIGLFALILRGITQFAPPEDNAAVKAFDAQTEWRPISSLSDRPAWYDKDGQDLWSAHKVRLTDHVKSLKPPRFSTLWKVRDPAHLRFVVPLLVIGLGFFAGDKATQRISDLTRPNIAAMLGAETITVDAWITPPDYVARAPIFLEADHDMYETPVFSEVTLRAKAPSAPKLVVRTNGSRKSYRFAKTPDGAYEVTITLDENSRLDVHWWARQAGWTLRTEPDETPQIEFIEPPVLEDRDKTKVVWSGSDDYGIEAVNLVLTLATPHPASPNDTARIPLELPGIAVKAVEEETTELDLTRHYWAGADVVARLEAIDGAGQVALSDPAEVKLPEKLFLQPLARAAQEVRVSVLAEPRGYPGEPIRGVDAGTSNKDDDGQEQQAHAPWLNERVYAPADIQRASIMLEALTYKPEFFYSDDSLYLGLSSAQSLLNTARSKADADEVDDLLWAVALKAEYGSAADALAALQAARAALERALREGASEEEIRRLTEAFRQAAENYVEARLAEAIANGLDAPPEPGQDGAGGGGGGDGFGQGSFEDMLDTLSDLTETGATDQARQLLSDISNLLENLDFQQGGQGGGDGFALPNQGESENGEEGEERSEAEQNLSDALEDLSETLRNQRELNDDTLESERRGDQEQTGSEFDPESLAERQDEIAEALGRLLEREADRANDARIAGEEDGEEGVGELSDEALQNLGQALRDQLAAEQALEDGATGTAQRYQQRATRLLNDAIGSISERLDVLEGEAENREQQTDPFGRELEEGTRGYGVGDVDLSGEEQRRRAQEVLEELRRRYGESLDPAEREYLERLLDRF